MRRQVKYIAVLSAAAVLSLAASMASFAGMGWLEENGSWIYYGGSGDRVKESWIKSGDDWYWLDNDGIMAANRLVEIKGDYYYLKENGAMASSQWISIPNENWDMEDEPEQYWYYFGDKGKAYKRSSSASSGSISAKNIDGRKYCFDTEGRMLYGWVSDGERQTGDDAWRTGEYYFGTENDGVMRTGWDRLHIVDNEVEDAQPGPESWDEDQDRWFYFTESGKKVKGREGDLRLKTINGNKYGFDEYGRMISSWYADPDLIISYDEGEQMRPKPPERQGQEAYTEKFMYFGSRESGVQYANGWFKTVPGYYLNQTRYEDQESATFYVDHDGNLCANEIKLIDGRRYAFDSIGKMARGLLVFNMGEDNSRSGSKFVKTYGAEHETYSFSNGEDFELLVAEQGELFYNHTWRFYNFNGPDGSMLTGKQQVKLGGEPFEFMFETNGYLRGSGVMGEKDNKLYLAGKLLKPLEYQKYAVIRQETVTGDDGNKYKKLERMDVVDFIEETCNEGIYNEKRDETVYTVRYTPPDVKYYLIGPDGDIVRKKKAAVDMDGFEFRVEGEEILTITVED